MKKKLIALLLFIAILPVYSQNMTAYSDGVIELVEDSDFGKDTDWKSIFKGDEHIGDLRDDLVVANDGTIFLSNYQENKIHILSENGEYLKSIGGFPSRIKLHSIMDNQYLITSDIQGKIRFFDFGGNLWKLLPVDYMVDSIVPLEEGRIAILGFIVTSEGFKRIVSIKNIETEDEKIIWSIYRNSDEVLGKLKIDVPMDEIDEKIFESEILAKLEGEESKKIISEIYEHNRTEGIYILNEELARERYWRKLFNIFRNAGYHQGIYTFTNPSSEEYCFINKTDDGNIVLGVSTEPLLQIFSPDGKLIKTIDTGIQAIAITDADISQFYQNTVDDLTHIGLDVIYAEKILKDGFFPENLPYYYDLISDDNGSFLLFTFTENKPEYRFNVYSISSDGQDWHNCLFDARNYQLNLTPMVNNKTIVNNYFYTIVADSSGTNQDLRVVKVRMK